MTAATTEPVNLPPGPRVPKALLGIALLIARHGGFAYLARRYGDAFTVNIPFFGRMVVVSSPADVKELFTASRTIVGRPTNNLGDVLGRGSTFSLDGDELHERRRLLLPPFHGKGMRSYERITEEEVLREIATWPEGQEFETLEPMMRISLNTILRAVFGAEGPALEELRTLMPVAVEFGSRIALMPSYVRRDLGPWSPGGRFAKYRKRMDALIASLMAEARSDPNFEQRQDVLTLLLQARYEDGRPISDEHIADELLTLLVAGHETTSAQLSWAIERIRRHPDLLSRLYDEVDAGGSELRLATISEVQRTRPVLTAALRRARTRIKLGEWVIPEDTTVMASIQLALASENNFPDSEAFNPDRFMGANPSPFAYIPFGGGMMRCVGASFATMEMDVALRTMLRELKFEPTSAPAERRHTRGVSIAPAKGGRAVVFRRKSADKTVNAAVGTSVAQNGHQ
ncbi:cytochrome P450 [Mycolicibacterium austroafricanum]|uniref:cytochrome P450 n=1 Tax=Mycolicibacterium austroafricanum TaxID=39687 RepID=UPI001CA32E0B|nr:cytochrome P450 [Mycolicibacterium austroafricanum]QZT64968.1 cytochrome P450 [Mycolicibacterium austroafricanum]